MSSKMLWEIMMQSEKIEILKKVCCDVFEQLAFMFGEELDRDEVESDSESFISAEMTFSGHLAGSIELIVPSELTRKLAYNILGLDDNDKIDQGGYDDALKELLNTICGRMLTSTFGEEAVFDLHVPLTSQLNNSQWEAVLDEKEYIAIDIEDSPVLIHATFQDNP